MSYQVEFDETFDEYADKLDKSVLKICFKWINKKLVGCKNPRFSGKPLNYNLKNLWRYRIGDYRLIVQIQEEKLIILALGLGHRKEIYSDFKK